MEYYLRGQTFYIPNGSNTLHQQKFIPNSSIVFALHAAFIAHGQIFTAEDPSVPGDTFPSSLLKTPSTHEAVSLPSPAEHPSLPGDPLPSILLNPNEAVSLPIATSQLLKTLQRPISKQST